MASVWEADGRLRGMSGAGGGRTPGFDAIYLLPLPPPVSTHPCCVTSDKFLIFF